METISPEKLSADIEKVLDIYINDLEKYTESEFLKKQNKEIWSIGQMYQHLYESGLKFFLANSKRCLEKRNGIEGEARNKLAQNIYSYNSFPPQKFQRPGATTENEPVANNIEFYKQALQEWKESSLKMINLLKNDAGIYKTNHPIFGYLNAIEWVWNMEIHARHHLRQKKELESFLY